MKLLWINLIELESTYRTRFQFKSKPHHPRTIVLLHKWHIPTAVLAQRTFVDINDSDYTNTTRILAGDNPG